MAELTAVRDADGAWRFDSAVTASAIPVKPPASWFDDPQLTEPTALTVTADGRVYGHAAAWGIRHIGLPGHRTAPRSTTDYREYLRSQVEADDGSMIATGPLTLGGGHAGLDGDITAAVAHYDDVSSCVADVRVSEDDHGIWMAGALRPGTTPEQVRQLRGSAVSGDWRAIHNGQLALCAIHAVNTPGFAVPRASLAASGAPTALVAAGMITREASTEAAPKQQSPDLTTCRTPEEVAAVASQNVNTEHDDDTEDESVTAAAPPFSKGEPAPDDGDSGGDFSEGDTVMLDGLDDVPMQVTGRTDSGDVVVEVTVSPDRLSIADEAMAAAAWQRFDERQQDRVRDSKLDKLTAAVEGLVASGQAQQETIAAQAAHIDTLQRERNSAEAQRLLASAGIGE